MTQAWFEALSRASLQGGLLALFVWAIVSLWRRSSPGARAWLWLIVPAKFLAALWFVVELPLLAPTRGSSGLGGSAETVVMFSSGGASAARPFDWGLTLFCIWLLGAALVVARALREQLALGRLVRESFEVSARVGVLWPGGEVELREHPDVGSPMVVGLVRPVVLLPESLGFELGDEEVRMVLAHEAAHIRRRDALASLYVFVCVAVFWFHPAAWIVWREWRVERELACDHEAMSSLGVEARDYAAMLIKVCAGAERSPVLALSAVPTYRTLRRRINDMKRMQDRRTGRVLLTLFAVLVSAAALPVVLVQRKPHFGAGVFETVVPATEEQRSQAPARAQGAQDVPVRITVRPSVAGYGVSTGRVERVTAPTLSHRSTIAVPVGQAADRAVTYSGAARVGQSVAPTVSINRAQTGTSQGVDVTQTNTGVSTRVAVAQKGLPTTGYRSPAVAPTTGVTTTVGQRGLATTGYRSPALVPTTGVTTTVGQELPTVTYYGAASAPVADPKFFASGRTTQVSPTLSGQNRTTNRGLSPSVEPRGQVTLVMRDKADGDGEGLAKRVSVSAEAVDVVAFLRTVSAETGVRISVKGVRSTMKLTAQIEGVTLREVIETVSKAYGLTWRLEGDGSITVEPSRG